MSKLGFLVTIKGEGSILNWWTQASTFEERGLDCDEAYDNVPADIRVVSFCILAAFLIKGFAVDMNNRLPGLSATATLACHCGHAYCRHLRCHSAFDS